MNAMQFASPSSPILRRACACGGTPGPTGECESCREKRLGLRRQASAAGPAVAPPVVHDVLASAGRPLDAGIRAEMEPRFRHSFADVRVHADGRAADSARAVSAHAYTVGRDVVFAAGRYAPGSAEGRRLIAHELAHVVQQRGAPASVQPMLEIGAVDDPAEPEADHAAERALAGGSAAPPAPAPAPALRRLRRAYYDVGGVRVQIDYGGLAGVEASGGVAAHLLIQYATYVGATPPPPVDAAIQALTPPRKVWLMYALDLLIDNTTPAHAALNRARAVQRLVAAAPSSVQRPVAGGQAFSEEVLRVSGWYEVALAAPLRAPAGSARAAIDALYNPAPVTPPGSTLNEPLLNTLLRPALTAFLQARDPAAWATTTAVPLAPVQAAATEIQAIARDFFAPYAPRASTTPFATGWNYASQIFSVTATPSTHALRVGYLTNRAKIVGADRSAGPSIFARVTYDNAVPGDRAALNRLATAMANDPGLQPLVDRLVRHTGRADPATNDVGLSTELPGNPAQCALRWNALKTVCHELVHVLAHPRLRARTATVTADQLVREGFTEVLGVQLYHEVRRRAAADPALQARLEGGVAGSPCSPIPSTSVGYGQDGIDALEVQRRAGPANFRAAYFLGALHLVGL